MKILYFLYQLKRMDRLARAFYSEQDYVLKKTHFFKSGDESGFKRAVKGSNRGCKALTGTPWTY
jgi:hypothetical protein